MAAGDLGKFVFAFLSAEPSHQLIEGYEISMDYRKRDSVRMTTSQAQNLLQRSLASAVNHVAERSLGCYLPEDHVMAMKMSPAV